MDLFEILNRKEDLHADLADRIFDRGFGRILSHPLIIEPLYHENRNALINMQYQHKLEALERLIEEKNYISWIHVHERPYRLEAMLELIAMRHLETEDDFNACVRTAWIDSENIFEFFDEWKNIWRLVNPKLVMNSEERDFLEKMPASFEIYRGLDMSTGLLEGMSWTVKREKAEWFARRFSSQEPTIATAIIEKNVVKAYFNDRNEAEIVINPDDLGDVITETL